MNEEISFIYNHIRRMDEMLFGIRKNLCNIRRKTEFDVTDLANIDLMLRFVVNFQTFIITLSDKVEADLERETSWMNQSWSSQKRRILFQLKCTGSQIMSDRKSIQRRIEKKKSREHDEALRKKLEEMRLKRDVKDSKEGSN